MSAEEIPLTTPPERRASGEASTDPSGLTLVSVSRDGGRMLFVDATGQEFAVEVDDRLRSALPAVTIPAVTIPDGTPGRLPRNPGRSERSPMTDAPTDRSGGSAQLRPREIQTRIRAGESVEDVAVSAGTTVEKLMPFAGPVLAEREHMAERAQGGSLRRRGAEPAGNVRTLGQAVAAQLGTFYLDPDETVAWDSYRRPDGRWQVVGEYAVEARTGRAELIFDVPGNYVSLANDDARWLVGDLPDAPASPTAEERHRDELSAARQRRLSVIEEVALGVEPPIQHPDDAYRHEPGEIAVEQPVEAYLDAPQAEAPQAAPEQQRTEQQGTEQPKPSRKKRSSVPSWDEIMFGGGK